jgi:dynein intermediate chain
MDKKSELDLKKQKLDEIRKRRADAAAAKSSPDTHTTTSTLNTSHEPLNVDPNQILLDCGIDILTTPVVSRQSLKHGSTSSLPSFNDDARSMLKNKKPVKLTTNVVNVTDIPAREVVTYTKDTQTPATDIVIDAKNETDYYKLTYDTNDFEETVSLDANMGHQTSKSTKEENLEDKLDQQLADDLKNIDDRVKQMQLNELNEEERLRMLESDDFLNFFQKNARILEKALEQDDIFFEYGASEKNAELVETGQAFKLNKELYDDRWRNRIVTWMDWSPHFPELLLASYEDSSLDPDGVALVWNTKFKTTGPEFIFNCSSWVTSCCFAKFHPNLIIGGTYSGQIVMWDNRSNKRTPVQRSSLSAASHTHPIHCVQVVGSQNAHNLISISNDGKLCSWTLDNMNTPQETLELQCKQTKQVAVTSMGFRSGDVNNFVVGSEEGPIYMATRHGNKSGINESYEGHFGPVTGLSPHQVAGPIDFSQLFLTSSFDWTVKLWNLKEPGKPLYSFEHNSDYVYDVAWSPTNPALFACVDGTGRLDLWNLINDTEVPTASLLVDGAPALNKVRWHQSGHQVAVGDDQGKIILYDLNESYANARADDWTRLVRVLQDFKQNQSELDETPNGNTAGISSVTQQIPGYTSPQQTSLASGNSKGTAGAGGENFDFRKPLASSNMSSILESPKTSK